VGVAAAAWRLRDSIDPDRRASRVLPGARTAAPARGSRCASIHARMALANRRDGDDAGVGRSDGSVFFTASRAGSAVLVQSCVWRSGTRAADGLSVADRATKD